MAEAQKRLRTTLGPLLLDDAIEVGEIERGAYSSLVKVRWQGTEYSGKKLHDFPLRLEKKKGEEILMRLKRHCELVSSLTHPNIVQHIGLALSSIDTSPILVHSSLPTSVASILCAHSRFPPSIQLSILQDVAQGLAYLHSRIKPVVHGDLDANNVLLTRGLNAKLSNMGVASIIDPKATGMSSLTKSAEQASYVPPGDTMPTTAGDVFSYGVLTLHIATGKCPVPTGEATKTSKELDRRKMHIDSLPEGHCLLPLIKDCLQNDPVQRPQAMSLVERLTRLSSQQPIPFQTALELMITMERREGELVSMVDQLKAGQEEVEGIGKRLSTYDLQLAAVKDQMKSMEEQLVVTLEGPNCGSAICSLLQPPTTTTAIKSISKDSTAPLSPTPILKPTQSVFHWKRAPNAPVAMQSATAIVLEGKLYIGGGETKDLQTDRILYEYDISGMVHKWTALPMCPVAYFALGVVNKSLVLVGGVEIVSRKTSNKLYMWDRERQEWSATLPSMSVARQNPAVAAHNLSLIVAGGYKNKKVLADVEVFDQATFQWIQFPSLPLATSGASCCIVRDVLYVLGGTLYGESGSSTVVQAISLTGDPMSNGWTTVKDTPLTKSYAVPSNNFVMAVGGSMPGANTPTRSIYVYFPAMDRWNYLCDMPTARTKCIASVLSAGRLIVIGGNEEHGKTLECGSTVEVLYL